jgi:hypothetical protein
LKSARWQAAQATDAGSQRAAESVCSRLWQFRHGHNGGQLIFGNLFPQFRQGLPTMARGTRSKEIRSESAPKHAEIAEEGSLSLTITPADVAPAFLHQALELKTTADVTNVDGGNITAAMR